MIKPLPWNKVKPLVQRLGLLRTRRICKEVLGKKDCYKDTDFLEPGEVLVLTLATSLLARTIVTEEQQDLIISEYGEEIRQFGNIIYENKNQKTLKSALLNILDRTFVRMSGQKEFIDLRSGSKSEKLELAPIEIIILDLASLLYRTMKLADKLSEKSGQHAADRQANVQAEKQPPVA